MFRRSHANFSSSISPFGSTFATLTTSTSHASSLITRLSPLSRALTTKRARKRISLLLTVLIVASMLLDPFSRGMSFAQGTLPSDSSPAEGATIGTNTTAMTDVTDVTGTATPVVPLGQPPVPILPTPDPTNPHPYLAISTKTDSQTVTVGSTFTATIVIENQSPTPAVNLMARLPLPAGVQPANPGQGGTIGSDDLSWQWASLGAYENVAVTAALRLTTPQPGGAVLLRAQITATNVEGPLTSTGGALVVDASQDATSASYAPGTETLLRNGDNSILVKVPSNAHKRQLTLRHSKKPKAGSADKEVTQRAGFKQGFEPFYLNATDDTGNDVHQFDADLTLELRYTPEQLEALGIDDEDLTLLWFDPDAADADNESSTGKGSKGKWVSIATNIDPENHTATAKIDHFSLLQLADGASPSEAYLPSLQGWQVGLYTGNVSYQYPIDVPAGPGGTKPGVSLSYNSTSSDGKSGMRPKQQSGWVGKDWSLDTGYIALNRHAFDTAASRYYSLVFDGRSYDLVRGATRNGGGSLTDPTKWEWYTTDESFIRVRAEYAPALAGRGGSNGNGGAQRYKWQIWMPNGTRYDFEEDAWQGFQDCSNAAYSFIETYKWYLTRVEDTHGNRITYNYWRNQKNSQLFLSACGNQPINLYPDYSVWPTSITWGSNINVAGSTDRYKVEFGVSALPSRLGLEYESADTSVIIGGSIRAPHETKRLDSISVYSMQAATWELVRKYNLGYAAYTGDSTDFSCPTCLLSDDNLVGANSTWAANAQYPKLTLTSIQQRGNSGTTALPPATFTYGLKRHNSTNQYSTEYYPRGDWNRLTQVNNGQGGKVTFAYDDIGVKLEGSNPGARIWAKFRNNRRVISRTVEDGRGNSYTWNYDYMRSDAYPAYNSLGIANGEVGPNQNPNSAVLYYNKYYDTLQNLSSQLIHAPYTEFRGHNYVVERDPNSNETEHWFYQGDVVDCDPNTPGNQTLTSEGNQIANDACFWETHDREVLKGKEYQTVVHQGTTSGPVLSQSNHTFTVSRKANINGYDPFVGLWRSYSYESQTVEKSWEGAASSVDKRTTYEYDTSSGNLLAVNEYAPTGALYRRTAHSYASTLSTDNARYIIDRNRKDTVTDGAGKLLAHTIYGWDGSLGGAPTLTEGELTLVRKYFNLNSPPTVGFPASGSSTDTRYEYDSWGNQIKVYTYSGAGVTDFTTNPPTYGVAGGPGAVASITVTDYDTVFHALPVKITPPIATLAETAQYDAYGMRMGLMTSITDPNSQVTSASYDQFGRLISIIKPGDNSTYPTFQAAYVNYDAAAGQPFIYETKNRFSTAGTWDVKLARQFYDGLGRKIQTKTSSNSAATQSIVVDTVYDGLGQAIKQSQPRYHASFWTYTPPSTDTTILWSTSEYDALGRTKEVTTPDNKSTSILYKLNGNWLETVTYDAEGHKKAHASDVFGRLAQVRDFTGTLEPYYVLYSTTNYAYSPLDLLTTVTDANNVVTSMSYDSLGRKTSMSDPTMGNWSYEYYADGTLKKQNDPRGQNVTFEYDAMDRLRYRRFSNGQTSEYLYDESFSANGKGQRTTMQRWVGANVQSITQWQYDARGRQTQAAHYAGLPNGGRSYFYAYDSGDRMTSMMYPSGETVYYRYDALWRQTSVCSDPNEVTCYGRGAQYTALDQPDTFTYGNGLVQDYVYDPVMKRLSNLKLGTTANPTSVSNRTYAYDSVGNVQDITIMAESQHFTYDHLDRLGGWTTTTGVNETYTYDKLGNILSKGATASPVSYTYTPGVGNGGPYAVDSLSNGQTFSYDQAGNMTSSTASSNGGIPARTYSFGTENLPTSITSGTGAGAVTENYVYDADGERIKRTLTQGGQSTTTNYIGGMYEEDQPSGITRSLYTLNGQVVAQKEVVSGTSTVIYLHSDHLGSISTATNQAGGVVSSQKFDPWGKVRPGLNAGIPQTKLNYTGQKLDDTGLLYYHARYYDPSLARFVSADSIVPGVSPLLMDLSEASAKKEGTEGTEDPRNLNRYSYVLNNPLGSVDLSGHRTIRAGTAAYRLMIHSMYGTLRNAVDRDPDFATLRDDAKDGQVNNFGLWMSKVEKDGAWDAGKGIRELFGAGPDDSIYFSGGGRNDAAYSLFGNILFGYLGAGVGFTPEALRAQGSLFNLITDPKGLNEADAAAVAFGIDLWNRYGANITEEELAMEISKFMRTHKVHTKRSVEACMKWPQFTDLPGKEARLACHGEAP